MTEFVIIDPNQEKCFLTQGSNWSGEYPNARIFTSLQEARRVRDRLIPHTAIYTTEQYALGLGPTVPVQDLE